MSADVLSAILPLLERLVAFDSRNPPRAIGKEGLYAFLAESLGQGFRCTLTDLGDGCLSLLAVRGNPRFVFNVHVDTVPADPGWKDDPLRLRVEGDRAIGLGAADIKGAAACMLVAASRTQKDAALLFTSDEEAGTSRCIKAFLAEKHPFAAAIVAEPTRCEAIVEHRGIASCLGHFHGRGGHASAPRALEDSAVHEAVRWASRALSFAEESQSAGYKNLSGIRYNLGILQGGQKSNMIAAECMLRYGVRPLPSQDPRALLAALNGLAPRPERVTWEPTFIATPLPAALSDHPGGVEARVREATSLAGELGLRVGAPVDFWTEAALFSESGKPAIVYGPGDIAEAHTAGEWVRLVELVEAEATYERIFG
ncbi:MAG: acetylornithine deacetylase [Byssovorax sp.]